MNGQRDLNVHMVPIEKITVVNSRARGQTKFRQMISNSSHIGLKRPITVSRRQGADGETRYDLVCGQGRLEAYIALGQKEVPALVVDVPKEELLLMSLAENLARRHRSSLEMAKEIMAMKQRGFKVSDIAKRVDLDRTYVKGIIRLLENNEDRLLLAVEHRQMPLRIALAIMDSDDREIEQAMTDAFNKGELRGRALLRARELVARRRSRGKGWHKKLPKGERISAYSLVAAYRKETARQKVLIARAKACEIRLRFVVSAMKKLLADEGFVNLLRAESLTTMPKALAGLVNRKEESHAAIR